MKKKLDMILDNQCMIIGMILKLDKDQELFDERDISMIDKQLEKIKKISDNNCTTNEGGLEAEVNNGKTSNNIY